MSNLGTGAFELPLFGAVTWLSVIGGVLFMAFLAGIALTLRTARPVPTDTDVDWETWGSVDPALLYTPDLPRGPSEEPPDDGSGTRLAVPMGFGRILAEVEQDAPAFMPAPANDVGPAAWTASAELGEDFAKPAESRPLLDFGGLAEACAKAVAWAEGARARNTASAGEAGKHAAHRAA
jgi:hypothetical protein